MTNRHLIIAITGTLISIAAWPCGPMFPNSYIIFGGEYVQFLPYFGFGNEMSAILGNGDQAQALPEDPATASWQRTLEEDVRQLGLALKDTPEKDAELQAYKAMREAMHDWMMKSLDATKKEKEAADDAEFDLAPYEDLLQKIPLEFAAYARGASAYNDRDYDSAIVDFESIRLLSPDQRKYRTLWAEFMLGKCWLKKEPSRAIPHFEQVRQLASQGAEDPLNMAADSIGWQARAEMKSGDFAASIHHYIEAGKQPGNQETAVTSLAVVCAEALSHDPVDPALINDAICNRVLTLWIVSSAGADLANKWLAALEKENVQGEVPGADYLACIAYQHGDMAAAQRWLSHCAPDTFYAQCVRAKLLLRDGNAEEAAKVLQSLAQSSVDRLDNSYLTDKAKGDLAMVRFQMNDYPGALDAFLRAGRWEDAVYIAEQILTIDQLDAYLKSHADDEELQKPHVSREPNLDLNRHAMLPSLRHLFGRRLARLGQWQRAGEFYPNNVLHSLADDVGTNLRVANDASQPPRKRAEAFFEAARITHEYGMDLLATELGPDFHIVGGMYEWITYPNEREDPNRFIPSPEQERLAQANAASPNQRFHYRYKAAELMKECADLLPNNDPKTAEALYLGGTYLKNRDPKAADFFYKALVRRNPNLLIAQQADKLRWFPSEFTDKIAYHPLPSRWVRHRILIITSTLAVPLIALAGIILYMRRKKARRMGHVEPMRL